MRNIFLQIAILIVSNLFTTVYACDCSVLDLNSAKESAATIFLGTALVHSDTFKSKDGSYSIVPFKVEKSWKGVTGHKAQVKMGSTMCSFQFEAGKKYLVFSSGKGPIYTSGCSRTALVESAAKDVTDLGNEIPLK